MRTVVSIVEGDGEVAALPLLLRRLDQLYPSNEGVEVAPPIRVRKDRFLNREEEFHRMLLLASAKCGDAGWILVLLDADDACPVELGASILQRIEGVVGHRRAAVVLANREFEAWFIASATSLHGRRGFVYREGDSVPDPDAIRGAKEWLSQRIPQGRYRETTDQAAFAAQMDIELARARSRSFRKLCKEWLRCNETSGQ